jgi:hypothetical protein
MGEVTPIRADVVTDDEVMGACNEYVQEVWRCPLAGAARTSVRMVLAALRRADMKVVRN